MGNTASRAKYVAALTVGVVGAGVFAGVSHDGRGSAAPAEPDPVVEAPSTTTAATTSLTTAPVPSSVPSSVQVESTQPALPATPDPVPTRARLRSRGS